MSDEILRDIVIAEIRRQGGPASIGVSILDGVVTLTGEVQEQRLRTLIEQELLRLPAVCDVHNQLRVSVPAGALPAQLLALLAREGACATGIDIRAAGGVVTLSGQAESWFDRDAAERLAWMLPGVGAVINHVTLPAGAVDPAGEDEGSAA